MHITLGWIDTSLSNSNKVKVQVFDGQHKAAAQILLGVATLPVRVFIDPDTDRLLTANTHAGTTLRQVAFDKSVQRSLGSSLLADRMDRYRSDRNILEDDDSFSEQDLVNHFRGESREMKRYVLDWVRNSITTHSDNKLRDYIDYGGRGTEMPLSYSTVEKTFYSFFVYGNWLRYVRQIVQNHFISTGAPIDERKLFQYLIPEACWENIEKFVIALHRLPLWINRNLSLSVFGGKRNNDYWQSIFESGQAPDGTEVMAYRINTMEMIKSEQESSES